MVRSELLRTIFVYSIDSVKLKNFSYICNKFVFCVFHMEI